MALWIAQFYKKIRATTILLRYYFFEILSTLGLNLNEKPIIVRPCLYLLVFNRIV